jgi:peptidoglycan/xylan/chitin deacetylase (PgdA/CDA1 family)
MRGECAMTRRPRRIAAHVARNRVVEAALVGLEHRLRVSTETVAVLTYHRVGWPSARQGLHPALLSATPDEFERQVGWLARRFALLSMDDLQRARARRRLPKRALLITFDDGYADFAEHAWPILRDAAVPATLFVATGAPGADTGVFWWDRLYEAVLNSSEQVVETGAGLVNLEGLRRDPAAFVDLTQRLKRLRHADLLLTVDTIIRAVGHTTAGSSDPAPAALDWSTIRRLHGEGLGVAAHTRTHPILPMLSPAEAKEEIEGSRADLAARVPGSNLGVFAYPSGRYDARTVATVERLGFELAFSTDRGLNRLGRSDRLRLRRFNVGALSCPGLLAAQFLVAPILFHDRASVGERVL